MQMCDKASFYKGFKNGRIITDVNRYVTNADRIEDLDGIFMGSIQMTSNLL